MGAVYLQNGACIPPMTDDPIRQLKMIENEISKLGEAAILEAAALDRAQVEKVVAHFRADRDEQYHLMRPREFRPDDAKVRSRRANSLIVGTFHIAVKGYPI